MLLVCVCSVSLQSDNSNHWPGMQNIVFLLIFCGSVGMWIACCVYVKHKKNVEEKLFSFYYIVVM